MKQNNSKIKKVWWYDITPQTWVRPQKPFLKYLSKCFTVGRVISDKDCVIVVYSENKDDDNLCFDIIPKSIIIKIEDI